MPDRDIEAVPAVDQGDGNQQGCDLRLTKMLGDVLPHGIRYRIGLIGQPRQAFRQFQRRAFGIAEERRFPPGGNSEDMIQRGAVMLEFLGVHVDTNTAAIDLAGAQMHQIADASGSLPSVALFRANMACMASGRMKTGLGIRDCMGNLLGFRAAGHIRPARPRQRHDETRLQDVTDGRKKFLPSGSRQTGRA